MNYEEEIWNGVNLEHSHVYIHVLVPLDVTLTPSVMYTINVTE